MPKTLKQQSVLGSYTPDALKEIVDELVKSETTLSPLELYALFKRGQMVLDALQENILSEANVDFQERTTEHKDRKLLTIRDYASVTENAPRATWVWPTEIVSLETQLKSAKELAKTDGSATKSLSPLDPNRNQLFRISVHKL